MPSVILGISMLTHLAIIVAVKTKNFLDFALFGRRMKIKTGETGGRMFTSFAIALIMEFVILLVFIGTTSILGAGLKSEKSNYKMLESAFIEFEQKSVGLGCLFKKKCGYEHPDVSIPLS